MTTEVQEENANPYNMNKPWHTEDEIGFQDANGVFFEKPKAKKEADIEEPVEQEATKDEPYKRPDYKKRYDDLKKHYDSKLNEFKSREQELLDEATKNRQDYIAPKSPEELEKFKEEYPDVYEVVETVSHLQAEEKSKDLREKLERLQQREQELVRKDAEKRLMDKHPDFEDIRNSDDFHGWAKEQPKSIQDWVYNNADDADLASRALDLFNVTLVWTLYRRSQVLKSPRSLLLIWSQLKQQRLNHSKRKFGQRRRLQLCLWMNLTGTKPR